MGTGSLDHITISPTSTSVVAGQPASYTVTAVDNFNGPTDVTSSATLTITNGTCTANSCISTVVGPQTVTAHYSGKTATATQTVSAASTTIVLTSNSGASSSTPTAGSSVTGQSINYTATVSAVSPGTGTPQGSVTFAYSYTANGGGSGTLCSGVALVSGSATCGNGGIFLAVDSPYTITATYNPSPANYVTSNAHVTENVNKATPTVSISNLPASGTYGGSFTPTYTVTPAADNGATSVTSNSPSFCTVTSGTVNYVGVGTCSLTAAVATTTNYAAASGTAQTFNIGKAALTITANNMSMTYGTTPPTVTYTPSGLQGSDTISSIGLTVTCITSATSSSNAGSAQTTSCSGAASTTNYTVTYVAGTMTVNKATPTVSISNLPASGTYGGSFTPTYTVTPAADNGATSVTSNSTGVCTVTSGTVNYVGVGTCSLTAAVATTTNYAAASGTAQTFNIGKAALTITANNMSMTYGTTPPTVTYTPSGLQGSDTISSIGLTVTCITSATSSSNAGSAQTTSCSGAASTTNYTVTYVAGTMTVNKATPTVSISNLPASGTYGGSFTPTYTVTPAADNGATSVTSNSPSFCTVTSGTVNYVGVGTCSLTAAVATTTNYAAASGTAQTFNIGKAALTITANNMSMTYGTTPPTVTYTPSGLQGSDTISSIGLTVTCITSATSSSNAGSAQTTSCSGAASTTNYTVTYVAGTMTVNKATPTVSISNLPASGTYGGSFTPTYTVTPAADNGATSVTSNSPSFCTVTSGTVNYVGVGTCSLTAAVATTTNYAAASGTAQTFNIGKAALTITANNMSMTYGTTPPTVTYTPSGLQGSDTISSIGLTVTCITSATSSSNAGSAQTTSCSGAASTTNYTVTYVAGTMTVNKATPTVSISNLPASGTYGGSFTPTYTVTPAADNGATSVTSNSPSFCTVTSGTVNYVGVGTCSLTAAVATTTNYAAASGTAQTFNIGKAALTITANNMSMTYGTTPPTVTYTPSGLQGSDTISSIGLTVTCITSATSSSNAGSAQTTSCSGAASTTNYTVTYVAGTMTVNQATPTVSISNLPASGTYGGSFTPTYTVTPAADNGATSVTSNSTGVCTVTSGTVNYVGVGTCSLTAHVAATTNYTAASGSAQTFTVNQAPAITSATSTTFTQGTGGNFTVTTTGSPTVNSITNANFGSCMASSLSGTNVSFAYTSGSTASITSTSAALAGTYTLCLNASNGINPTATQQFTLVIGLALPFNSTTVGTYKVAVPAGKAVTISKICGGAGGGAATNGGGGTGGGAGCVSGGIPAQSTAYLLTVTIAAGGQTTGQAFGLNTGGAAGSGSGNAGGGGGGSSALQVGSTNILIAGGGGGGGAGSGVVNGGNGGSGGTTSPGSGNSGTDSGTTGTGGNGGAGNGSPANGTAGSGDTTANAGGGGAGATNGFGGMGTSGRHKQGGGAGGDLVDSTGAYAVTTPGYSAGTATAVGQNGAAGSVSLS